MLMDPLLSQQLAAFNMQSDKKNFCPLEPK